MIVKDRIGRPLTPGTRATVVASGHPVYVLGPTPDRRTQVLVDYDGEIRSFYGTSLFVRSM